MIRQQSLAVLDDGGACLATLSMANIWKRPYPLPLLVVTLLVFLPRVCDSYGRKAERFPWFSTLFDGVAHGRRIFI